MKKEDDKETGEHVKGYYVNNVPVIVLSERVQYLDENGKLITVSLKDYSRATVRSAYTSLDEFRSVWNKADRKYALLNKYADAGLKSVESLEILKVDRELEIARYQKTA